MVYNQLGSGKDPVSSVFVAGDRILRGIRQEFREDYLGILSQPVVQAMLGNRIVETRVEEPGLPDYALTLEHRRIDPPSYCYEWSIQMLQDAALQTLEICIELNDAGLVLKDGTPWNILFDGSRPLLVDFTSIMPQEEDILWVAYDQFFRLFLFPLLVGEVGTGKLARALFLSSGNGISPEEIIHILPGLSWVKKPWLINRLYLPMLAMSMATKSGQDKKIRKYSRQIPLKSPTRRSFFEDLKRDVLSLKFNSGSSRWSKYYEDINAFFDPENFNPKQRVVADLLQRCQPGTVVDIGCNQGGYAILAAQAGARVIAFDTDEDSVNALYRLTNLKNLNILSLVGDVLYPAPQVGWRGIEFASAPTRFRSQMAFALALVHHLAITQIQTFERIVQALSDYTDRWLVTEFVPLDDPRSQELLLTNRRDLNWYSLDAFLSCLRSEFSQVEIFPSFPAGRTICFCQK
jgi:SAM-dependent methyltransferase